jgi:hypothetical protein
MQTLAVAVEFTGIARSYGLSSVIAGALPDAEILEIDPLDVREDARWGIGARARELGREIVGREIASRAPARVVIIGYCTAAVLCGRLGRQLAESGIQVAGTALLDPVVVDDELLDDALRDIESTLECGSKIRDCIPTASSAVSHPAATEELVRLLADEYAAANLPAGARVRSMVADLADRYISWISFLCSTVVDAQPALPRGRVAIFSAADGPVPAEYKTLFGADEWKAYPADERPCLERPDCAQDFRAWLTEVA